MRIDHGFIGITALLLTCGGSATEAANLVPWFTTSNVWHTVPTNEVFGRAAAGEAEAQCYLGRSYLDGLRGLTTNFAEARQWLLKSAAQDFPQAQNTLGWNAANGLGMRTNYGEAIVWYEKAANLGFPQAEMNLARMYRDGTGVAKEMGRALELYRRSSAHGFRLAKRELGILLCDDPGFGPREKQEGVQLLLEAANEGDATAQNRVGRIYWKGEGVDADEAAAQKWFLAAARHGSVSAMDNLRHLAVDREDFGTLSNLFVIVTEHAERGVAPAQMLAGRMWAGGLGTAQDAEKAMGWYAKAAAQDFGPALETVGIHYYSSTPAQDRRNYAYFQRGAAKGLKDSMAYAAELLLSGEAGITNLVAGIETLKAAAAAGSIIAQEDLGIRCQEGRGVPQNILEAVRWYSAVMTNTSKIGPQHWTGMRLGIIFATGGGLPRDDAEAFKWFKAAADFDGRDAQDSLGYCYATGRGVPQDDEEAVIWFRAAGGEDDPDDKWLFYPAVANLGVMYAQGRGGLPQDMRKAAMLFERAARHERFRWCRVPHAQTALAICLYEGNGTNRDMARASELFREAANDGNPQAQLHAGVLLWRGDGVEKDAGNAFVYLAAAAMNNEPRASAWRDVVEKALTPAQRAEGLDRARAIPIAQPPCAGSHGHRAWNLGLRLLNVRIVDAGP